MSLETAQPVELEIAGGTAALATSVVAIGVPVRNEVERLPRLLDALSRQIGAPPFALCLFFDHCIDGSETLPAKLAPGLPYAIISQCGPGFTVPNAGKARAHAMALAMRAVPADIHLTTDADSIPAQTWIAENCAALQHSDVVAGRINRSSGSTPDLQHRLASYFDRLHKLRRKLDPVPWEDQQTHHWTSGASLGFRAPVYRALGGFPEVPSGEDAALIDLAMRAGYRVRRDARVEVCTSSRREGRAPGGFAAALAHFDATPRLPDVAHPDDEAWRFAMQAEARALFERRDVAPLAGALRLAESDVLTAAAQSVNGEAFAAKVVGAPPGGMRQISIAHAEALLAVRETSPLAGVA